MGIGSRGWRLGTRNMGYGIRKEVGDGQYQSQDGNVGYGFNNIEMWL